MTTEEMKKVSERTAEGAYIEHMSNIKNSLFKLLENIKLMDESNKTKAKIDWGMVGSAEYVAGELSVLNEFFGE